MGDYFKDKEPEKTKKKEAELIEDFNTFIATYAFENERYQHTKDRDYDAIVPLRHSLKGDVNNPNDLGLIGELRKHLQLSKIKSMTIGQNMYKIMDEVGTLIDWDDRHMELLEGHVDHYQFLCESAIKIVENMDKKFEELNKSVVKYEEEQGELKKQETIGPPLSEQRKQELEDMYYQCKRPMDFGSLVNPKRQGRYLTETERSYLTGINDRLQRFKGYRAYEFIENSIKSVEKTELGGKDAIEKSGVTAEQISEIIGKTDKNIKMAPEMPVYSPLSQKQKKSEPLNELDKDDENEQQ